MKALLLNGPGKPFSIENIKDPTPEKGYAVAKVLACGSGLTIQHVKAGRITVNYPWIINSNPTCLNMLNCQARPTC